MRKEGHIKQIILTNESNQTKVKHIKVLTRPMLLVLPSKMNDIPFSFSLSLVSMKKKRFLNKKPTSKTTGIMVSMVTATCSIYSIISFNDLFQCENMQNISRNISNWITGCVRLVYTHRFYCVNQEACTPSLCIVWETLQ